MVQKLKVEIDNLKAMRIQESSNSLTYQRNGSPRSGTRPKSYHVQPSDNIDGAPVDVDVSEDDTPT